MKTTRFRFVRSACAAVVLGAAAQAGAATTIDFEGSGAPCCFFFATPLSDFYAGLGIHFSGDAAAGGSILNQSGNFFFNAHSGTDFLAFNVPAGLSGNIEQIFFDTPAGSVSIWGAHTNGGQATMEAFDASGTLLATTTVSMQPDWTRMSVSASGISRIKLTGAGDYYAYDDLTVSAVPEPATYGLLLAGLGLLGWAARRR